VKKLSAKENLLNNIRYSLRATLDIHNVEEDIFIRNNTKPKIVSLALLPIEGFKFTYLLDTEVFWFLI